MKRLFLMSLAAAGVLFASCSNDETIEVAKKNNEINFKSFINHSTRAVEDATTTNLKAFQVWGMMNKGNQTGKPFVGVEVTKGDGGWTYGTPVYWEKGYSYSFAAVAPIGAFEMMTAPATYQDYGTISFTNESGVKDLVYATKDCGLVTWENACPAAVHLTFNHMLSRVRFQFVNLMDDNSEIYISDVKIANACGNGTAVLKGTFADLAWVNGDTKTDYTFGIGTNYFANADTTEHKYMIPVTLTGDAPYEVTFTVHRKHAGGIKDTYNHTVQLPAIKLESGKSYQFTAKFDAKNIIPGQVLCPIKFTAEVSNWENWKDTVVFAPATGN